MKNYKIDLSALHARVGICSPGCVKVGGEKTDQPLIDPTTNKRIYWLQLKTFPLDSTGGEDVTIWAKCPSDASPVASVTDGAQVELINPSVELGDRGFSLVVEGVREIKAAK